MRGDTSTLLVVLTGDADTHIHTYSYTHTHTHLHVRVTLYLLVPSEACALAGVRSPGLQVSVRKRLHSSTPLAVTLQTVRCEAHTTRSLVSGSAV